MNLGLAYRYRALSRPIVRGYTAMQVLVLLHDVDHQRVYRQDLHGPGHRHVQQVQRIVAAGPIDLGCQWIRTEIVVQPYEIPFQALGLVRGRHGDRGIQHAGHRAAP